MKNDINHYDLHLHDGKVLSVQSDHHHDDHKTEVWHQHMIDIGKQFVSNIAAIGISKIIFKGRGPKG